VAPQQPDAFHLATEMRGDGFRHLSTSDVATIHERMLQLLEHHGVAIAHKQAKPLLLAAGCRTAADGERVSLPRDMVEAALRNAPKAVTLYGKTSARDIALPRADRSFIMRTGT
jgi:trimethylamine--corrinoid protein Co-methyltransferase